MCVAGVSFDAADDDENGFREDINPVNISQYPLGLGFSICKAASVSHFCVCVCVCVRERERERGVHTYTLCVHI